MFQSYAQSIKLLLDKRTHPELAAWYIEEMEVQVNVAADDGERIGDFKGHKGCSFTDKVTTWYPIRIPKDGTEDNSGKPMVYDLFAHAEGIGMTGWNWKQKKSLRFGYDFDAIIGHSEKHKKKMTDQELQEVTEKAKNIPWVTVRKSTGGSGFHLYVELDVPIDTENHTEHAALGRAILGMMSIVAGFDFAMKVDVCGGNMWVWHRKMKRPDGTLGLALVRQGVPLDSKMVPKNWRDHVKVVTGARKKITPDFVPDESVDLFEEMSGKVTRVKLDDTHKKLLDYLTGRAGWWDPDHNMLVTHTAHLEDAHRDLKMIGVFKTNSDKSNLDEQNCFAFPLRKGAWAVRRYSPGAEEHPTWEQDGVGYTKCFLNREPTLFSAAKARGGIEDEQGAYRFKTAKDAEAVAKDLGSNLTIPALMENREAKLKAHKDGNRLVVEVPYTDQDPQPDGWYNEKNKFWRKVLNVPKSPSEEYEAGAFDEVIRHAVTDARQDAGWYVKVNSGWHQEPLVHATKALQSLGKKPAEVNGIIGSSVLKPWTIVSIPFAEEYPGNRRWNNNAVQYMHPRGQTGDFSNWTKMLEHLGSGLNEALGMNAWAIANNIKTGGEYLKLILASILQDPYKPTPYIFLWSAKNNTGKSTLHNSLEYLISPKGIKSANIMLEQKDKNFNAEIVGAVVCTIEELDLRKRKDVYNKIKDLVTSPKIMIHPKGGTPYEMANTAHFFHMSNDHEACPIFPGDTRITMITVPEFKPGEHIPKDEFMELLRKEAPYFLNELLELDIPPSKDRLAVPVIDTAEKTQAAEQNKSDLEQFLEVSCYEVPGEMILFSDFYDKFQESLDARARENWSKIRVSKNMPPNFPVAIPRGAGTSSKYIGNLSLESKSSSKKKFIRVDKNYMEIAK